MAVRFCYALDAVFSACAVGTTNCPNCSRVRRECGSCETIEPMWSFSVWVVRMAAGRRHCLAVRLGTLHRRLLPGVIRRRTLCVQFPVRPYQVTRYSLGTSGRGVPDICNKTRTLQVYVLAGRQDTLCISSSLGNTFVITPAT